MQYDFTEREIQKVQTLVLLHILTLWDFIHRVYRFSGLSNYNCNLHKRHIIVFVPLKTIILDLNGSVLQHQAF